MYILPIGVGGGLTGMMVLGLGGHIGLGGAGIITAGKGRLVKERLVMDG